MTPNLLRKTILFPIFNGPYQHKSDIYVAINDNIALPTPSRPDCLVGWAVLFCIFCISFEELKHRSQQSSQVGVPANGEVDLLHVVNQI